MENILGEEESAGEIVPPSVRSAARGSRSFCFQRGTWSSRPATRWAKVSRDCH